MREARLGGARDHGNHKRTQVTVAICMMLSRWSLNATDLLELDQVTFYWTVVQLDAN